LGHPVYYLIARYYHPEHGVFLSLDPDPGDADDILTQNGYTYANNNLVMLVDPDGHWVWLAINAGFVVYDSYRYTSQEKDGKVSRLRRRSVLLGEANLNLLKISENMLNMLSIRKGKLLQVKLQVTENMG
jgi:RHS repeat-associated protein